MHKRDRPKRHQFHYPTFVFCIDLDEIEELNRKLTFFSYERPNLYSLQKRDHFREDGETLKENVVSYIQSHGVHKNVGRVELVTNLRTWGYVFNPVSFYFVYDCSDKLLCCLAEVANTFNEQKLYLVENFSEHPNHLKQSHTKNFYISPFSELATQLNFDLRRPDKRIKISITENDNEGTFFYSSLGGQEKDLSNKSLLIYSLRFPFITVGVMLGIHWQALRLALKKVPHFKKAHRPDLQTDTRVYIESKKENSA